MKRRIALVVTFWAVFGTAGAAAAEQASFDGPEPLKGWTVTGPIGVDDSQSRSGKALRIEPGGVAVLKLRADEGAGSVDLWVYEDMTVPADPKKRRVGPRWGLLGGGEKEALVVGAFYAPYLGGATTYTASDYRGDTWFNVTYLGECARKKGWHRWTFAMDAEKGLAIALDGKDANARRKRFDWNKTRLTGLLGVAIYGDEKGPGAQTIWVDDVSVTLGGPMKARPTPPPPPPPVVPETDPAVEQPVRLSEIGRGGHPRLLFGAEDIPRLRQFAQGEGKWLFDGLMKYLPVCTAPGEPRFLTDATDAQRQGFWRAPTAALHYVLTGDANSLEKAAGFLKLFCRLPHWEEGSERDSGMGAANIMIGAALAYDLCYDGLDPALRQEARAKLLWHARAMFHGGHLMKNAGTHYWQADPQNNHRWHRDAGLALCALAVAEGKPDEQWVLRQTLDELKFVADWLPPDGTSHEGPSYEVFGGSHLTLAMQAADRCLGTRHLAHPFFAHAPLFRLHTLTPGLTDAFHFGDCGGLGGYSSFLYKGCADHRLADAQAGLRRYNQRSPSAFEFAWFSLVWLDPTRSGGSIDRLAKTAFFPDLGLALVRDGWDANDCAAMFKCSPYGGAKLNEYRNANDFHYVNVAHDDPDINSFQLYARGATLAETSRYSKKKLTSSHNTILVGGKGQLGDGQSWTQPLGRGDKDMTHLAWVTAWKDAGDVAVVEGEGGGAYPDLDRYRRTFVWVKGAYVLVLDDIRAAGGKDVELAWLVQGPQLTATDEAAGRYVLSKAAARCEFQVACRPPLSGSVGVSTADNRGKPLGWHQLRLTGKAGAFRIATAYDLWARGEVGVEMTPGDDGAVAVRVRCRGVDDTWTWRPAAEPRAPSSLTGARSGKAFVAVTEKDTPPAP